VSDPLPFSQSCENNRQPIRKQLTGLLTEPAVVLEIGTGTGQHAEYFAGQLPHLRWLPTDHPDNVWMCRKRLELADLPNVEAPVALDVSDRPWQLPVFDHVYSANTAHIMAWEEVCDLFGGVAEGLNEDGCFCLYGPFNDQGEFSSESNRQFDRHLRARLAHMGLRDLQDLQALAAEHGMSLYQNHPMPANNRLLVFRKMAS
jgi:cyclopropane fatty-acyl-phospholipid synthase-like methyltransferase